ncbi:MAG: radical SAM protein [Deltaproteobacteria bacterium]|nr:MAG: radical SAM protein [Deltaproteobacteria bacterium]
MNGSEPGSEQLLDLIYPENRIERTEEIKDLFRSPNPGLPRKLHRVTLFLTFRCNLRCTYCNTILPNKGRSWPAKGKDYDFKRFKHVIDELVCCEVQHLHLTGGEATLVKVLPRMVEYASNKGIPCSLTTNGTADQPLYRELVEKGLTRIFQCATMVQ